VQAHLGPGCSRSWGGEHAGVGNGRRPTAVAAAARAPARLRLGVDNKRPWEVLWILGNRLERSAGGESERRRKFTGGGGNGWRGLGGARRGRRTGLNRPARSGDDGGVTQSRTTVHAGEETRTDRWSEGGRPAVAQRAWRGTDPGASWGTGRLSRCAT
jgi:hypothetical protein